MVPPVFVFSCLLNHLIQKYSHSRSQKATNLLQNGVKEGGNPSRMTLRAHTHQNPEFWGKTPPMHCSQRRNSIGKSPQTHCWIILEQQFSRAGAAHSKASPKAYRESLSSDAWLLQKQEKKNLNKKWESKIHTKCRPRKKMYLMVPKWNRLQKRSWKKKFVIQYMIQRSVGNWLAIWR